MQCFSDWLASRSEDPSQAEHLATLIAGAGAGAAGVSVGRLRGLLDLSQETLADLLRSLVATGQVEMVRMGGETRYRAGR